MNSEIIYSGDGERKNELAIGKTNTVQVELTHEQYQYIQHYLPKGFALIQKKTLKRDKKQSNPKIGDQTISRLSGVFQTGQEKESKKRERKKRNMYMEDEPPRITKRINTQKPVLDDEMQQCYDILCLLKKNANAAPFLQPVDPKTSGASDYLDVIKDPMDLSTVEKNLLNGEYQTANQFHGDIHKIWHNSYRYNDKSSQIFKMTVQMEKYYKKLSQASKKLKVQKIKGFKQSEIKTVKQHDYQGLMIRINNNSHIMNKICDIVGLNYESLNQINLQKVEHEKILFVQDLLKRQTQMTSQKKQEYGMYDYQDEQNSFE